MSEQIKDLWLKNLLKGKVWILGVLVLMLNVACGGGGYDDSTPQPTGTSYTTPSTTTSTLHLLHQQLRHRLQSRYHGT